MRNADEISKDEVFSALKVYDINPKKNMHDTEQATNALGMITGLGAILTLSFMVFVVNDYHEHGGLEALGDVPVFWVAFNVLLPFMVCIGAISLLRRWKQQDRAVQGWLSETVSDLDLAKLLATKLEGPRVYALMESCFLEGEVTYRRLLEISKEVERAKKEDRAEGGNIPKSHSNEVKSILGISA